MITRLRVRRLPTLAALILSAFLLSGCFLRSLFGNVIIVEDLTTEIDAVITAVEIGSTVAVCQVNDFWEFGCTYIVEGMTIDSTGRLLREFPLAGVLLDPVIVQVPADAGEIEATFDDGTGAQPALASETSSFEIQPGKTVNAESGAKLLILELPSAASSAITQTNPMLGTEFDLSLTFTQHKPHRTPVQPVPVKVLFAVKVMVRGQIYYAPVLPCVEDFADVPALTIPVSTTPVNLSAQLATLPAQGELDPCTDKLFNYVNVPPLQNPVYLPAIAR